MTLYDLQGVMNTLGGTSGLSAQGAANALLTNARTVAGIWVGSPPTEGEEVFPRDLCIAAGGGTLANQALRLRFFTASQTETITKIRTYAAVAAGATPTLSRIGVYSVAANGDIALIHSTANNTALWTATTGVDQALTASWSKVQGTRYAIGALCVTGASSATVAGATSSNSGLQSIAPRICGSVASQADLPASVVAGSISQTGPNPWFQCIR